MTTIFALFLLTATAPLRAHPQAAPAISSNARGAHILSDSPAQIFQRAQDALSRNQLDAAERDFLQVLRLDPSSGAAYANLGVVYMRRKQWDKALAMLHKAEPLMPNVAGIRLNIGL